MELLKKHLEAYKKHNVSCVSDGFIGRLEEINTETCDIKVSCSDWWESPMKYKMALYPLSKLHWENGLPDDISDENYNKLLEMHIDVFGLIDAGLAIDKSFLQR